MKENKERFWRYLFICVLIFVLVYLLVFLFQNPFRTGKAVLELRPEISGGLDGVLRIHMKEGEMIPANTQVIATLGNQKKEYRLYNLIRAEKKRGNFFMEESEVAGAGEGEVDGFGEGYGIPGKKRIYPDVILKLVVERENLEGGRDDSRNGDNGAEEESGNEEEDEEDDGVGEEENESEKHTEDVEINESEGNGDDMTGGNESGDDGDGSDVIVVNENGGGGDGGKGQADREVNEEEERGLDVAESDRSIDGKGTEETGEVDGDGRNGGGVTGFVAGMFDALDRFTGFAVRQVEIAPLTGRVITDQGREIEVSVSALRNFSLELEHGEILSVLGARSSLGDVELHFIHVNSLGNKAVISTNYAEEEIGFGMEYLQEKEHALDLDLKKLGLQPEDGFLNIVLLYRGEEIYSITEEVIAENLETEIESCSEMGGSICQYLERCSEDEINSSDGICCLGECTRDLFEGESENCVLGGFECKSACSLQEEIKDEYCESGLCCGSADEIKRCYELEGEVCDSFEICSGEEEDSQEGACCLDGCEGIEDAEENVNGSSLRIKREDSEYTQEIEEKVVALDISQLEIEGIFARNFVLGAVARFVVLIDNRRNIPLEEVYVNLFIGDAVFKSPMKTIPARSKTEIIAYGDTSGLKEGRYKGHVVFVYQGKKYEKNIDVKLTGDEARVVLQGKSRAWVKGVLLVFITIMILGVIGILAERFMKRKMLDHWGNDFKKKEKKNGKSRRK